MRREEEKPLLQYSGSSILLFVTSLEPSDRLIVYRYSLIHLLGKNPGKEKNAWKGNFLK